MKTNTTQYTVIKNNESIKLKSIPIIPYSTFCSLLGDLLNLNDNHCVNYFAFPLESSLQFIACIANDQEHNIIILSHELHQSAHQVLDSITPKIPALHIFEREIHENYAVHFEGHPWLKPVRYPHNRAKPNNKINAYPFYKIDSEELHEVSVGPIHAGIIEPGFFRFICNGENVLHLEIQRGWQHRGVETLMLKKDTLLQRTILAESIAGDTAIGHSLTFAQTLESLANVHTSQQLALERTLALELERIAIHIGDISALCTDIAYHLGSNIFGILRTGIINYTQSWCGNRLGKGMIRVGGTHYPFNNTLKQSLLDTLTEFETKFIELSHKTYNLPSVENRFDDIGNISEQQARAIGAVGMVARTTNIPRDIRTSHPCAGYDQYSYDPVFLSKGDVYSRFLLRRKEIKHSIAWIRKVLTHETFETPAETPCTDINLMPDMFCLSLNEAWRGEICHCALTDSSGNLSYYKVKDPSMHNWKALELSLRNLEISDFPINNKSYNLSYCGSDL